MIDDITTFSIPNGFGVNQIINNKEVGITTFVYGSLQVGAGSTDVIGIKGTVYKDILAAYQYPNLTNSNASDLLPLIDPIQVEYPQNLHMLLVHRNTINRIVLVGSDCCRYWRHHSQNRNHTCLYGVTGCFSGTFYSLEQQ